MRKVLISMLFGFTLAGCGSDGEDAFRPSPGPVAATITISSSAPTMPSDGSAPVTITVLARDAGNVLIAKVPVTFQATSGGLVVGSTTTGTNGEATATLGPAGDPTLRTITVTATSGALTASTLVQVVAPAGVAPPSISSDVGTNSKASEGTTVASSSPCIAESSEKISGIADVPAALVRAPGTGTVQILFADLSGSPLSAGTTVSGSVKGEGISLVSPSTFTIPCSDELTSYPFTIRKTADASAGALTITVTSPSGAESTLSYPIVTN
jgi:hypothetical protein